MRSLFVLLFAVATAAAQEAAAPEPGLISTDIVEVGELIIPAREGDAARAHLTFLTAHRRHEKGARLEALQGYLDFLGMPGHVVLPARYARTARARLDTMREEIGRAYARSLTLYRIDRAKGLVELRSLQDAYPMLPEGRAATALVQSDATRSAVRDARLLAEKGDKAKGARDLEKAVRANPGSLFLYEAKRLLVDLGGPDLFDPDERIGDDEQPGGPRTGEKKDDEESVIEIGD